MYEWKTERFDLLPLATATNSFFLEPLSLEPHCVSWDPLTTRYSPFSFCSPRHQVDLIILPLTSIPLVGFWKLIPTFGGCIATKAKCSLSGDHNQVVEVCG